MRARSLTLPILLLALLLAPAGARAQHTHQHAGDTRVCGTMLWFEAQADPKNRRALSALGIICDRRVAKHASALSPTQRFRIHYDLTGPDGVEQVDRNTNGIPDYIDSVAFYMDLAWKIEIDSLGFLPPLPDNRGPGDEIDVYICDLLQSIYGLTIPEPDNPTGSNTANGFMVLDNDYRGYPTPGIEGLKVTSAHEFHHLVQFSRYRYDFSQAGLYEATSVWMERKVHPDIPDYRQYLPDFLGAPQNFGFSTHKTSEDVTGYAHVLYMDYLEKRVGRSVVREIWERFATDAIYTQAIDLALRDHRLNLEDSWCEFSQWCYYTGARADGDTYFPEARTYQTMRQVNTRTMGASDEVIGGSLYPLSFGYYRVFVPTGVSAPDTVDFLITNARTNFGRGGPSVGKDEFWLEISLENKDGYAAVAHGADTLYYSFRGSSPQFCAAPILGGLISVAPTTVISPQPFLSDGAAQMLFGVNLAKDQVRNVRLWIYGANMVRVREIETREISALNNQLGVVWDGRDLRGDLVPSGVYLYQMSINDAEPTFGKFAVLRK